MTLIDLAQIKTDTEFHLYSDSLYEFLKGFWEIYSEDPFQDNWHIKYLCDLAQEMTERVIRREIKKEDLIVNVSPGTSKSAIFSVMLPAWAWIKAPWLKFITGSFEMKLATRMSVASRNIIRSEKYQRLFGDIYQMKDDQDGKTEYFNNRTGCRLVCSSGGSITGSHAHIIIIDDPLNPKEAIRVSEAIKNEVNEWFDHTLPTRKANKAITVTMLIMQRLAEDDPTGHLLEKGKPIKHICLPGEITDATIVDPPELEENYQDGFFDPIRLNRTVLDELYSDLRPKGYAGQILQLPAAAEGTIYKREWWKFYEEIPQTPIIRRIHSWDTAFTKDKQNAHSACVVAYQYNTGLYILDTFSDALEFPQLEAEIKLLNNKYPSHALLIENKASGISVIQALQQTTDLPVVPIPVDKDKIARAHAATPYCEAGNVYLPKNAEWTHDFIDCLAGFPDVKHKDLPDAFSQLINWIILQPSSTPTFHSRKMKIRSRF